MTSMLTMPAITKMCGIYTRISLDRDGTGLGVERQRMDGLKVAEGRDWPVHKVYSDNSVSAFRRGVVRPAFEQMVEDLTNGIINCVVVWKIDRMVRQPKDLERLIELAEFRGVEIATWDSKYDLRVREDRLRLRLEAMIAADASEAASDRIKRKHKQLVEDGMPNGGRRPFGYERDKMTVNLDEAVLLREAGDRVLRGESLRSIALDFTARRVPTAMGKTEWDGSNLGKILLSPRYAGLRVHHGEVVGDAAWPPIWDLDTHQRLVAILTAPHRKTTRRSGRVYLLRGFAYCSCGAMMVAHPQQGRAHYACVNEPRSPGCGKVARNVLPVDEMVTEYVIDTLMNEAPTVQAHAQDADELANNLRAEIARLGRKLEELDESLMSDNISTDQHGRLSRLTRDKINQTKNHLAGASGLSQAAEIAGSHARENWEPLSLEQKRNVIAELIERVVIYPQGKGFRRAGLHLRFPQFDPTKVQIVPR